MAIWKTPISLEQIMQRSDGSMSDFLGITFTDFSHDTLTAVMPVEARVKQPIGIMHGGASCVLAETVGSTAANFAVDIKTHYCVGLSINTSHIRSARSGLVTCIAKPIHLGRSTQVWELPIHDEAENIISVTRLTMAVLARA